MPRDSYWFPALILAISVVLASLFMAGAIRDFRSADRFVEVKGLAEREFPADLAIWPITYNLAASSLDEIRTRMDQVDEAVVAYLKLHGFDDEELRRAPPRITDRWLHAYDDRQRPAERYTVERTLTLRTDRVDGARRAMEQAAELVSEGVPLAPGWGASAEFLFTALDQVKPEMIAEATADARRAADQFAEDSGSSVGPIRSARQGFFSIDERDPTSPEIKRVRVVTTIEYFLVD